MKRIIYSCLFSITLMTSHYAAANQVATAEEVSNQFTKVAEQAIPAVVSVRSKFRNSMSIPGRSRGQMQFQDPSEFFQDDFWQRFFGTPQNSPQSAPPTGGHRPQIEGSGSGFIISNDGLILTNNHIVQDAESVTVILKDGREFQAEVLGVDPDSDIAAIKIESSGLPFLSLGDSDKLRVGQWVIAIGNPLGLQETLTVGVVSAKGRSNLGLTNFEDYIQTDAAINQGNSGGPLLTLDGKVVGMNTAFATKSGGYMGIGFAIPSNMIESILVPLTKEGGVTRSYLGIVMQKVDHDLAKAFNLERVQGALITQVVEGSPAEQAGIKQGDLILRFNGKDVQNIGTFRNQVSLLKPGTTLNLDILRNGRIEPYRVSVAPHPEYGMNAGQTESKGFGIKVESLTTEQAEKHGYKGQSGVLVSRVQSGSVADLAGIRSGMLILSVNNQSVSNPREFQEQIETAPQGRPVALLIRQGNITRFVSLYVSR